MQLSSISLAITSLAGGLFTPQSIFADGTQGTWYDPSDFSTLFQDSAGTTPVTAVEQPVGLMKDKSGRGNHAFQSTSANRPTLSARYNLLTKTEQFDDAVWNKVNQTVTPNQAVSPSGSSADLVIPTASGAGGRVVRQSAFGGVITKSGTISAVFKPNGYRRVCLLIGDAGNGAAFVGYFDLQDAGVLQGIYYSTTGTATQQISSLGNGWYRCTMQATSISNLTAGGFVAVSDIQPLVSGFPSAAADGVSGVLVADIDARITNDALNQPAYQRVNTSTDYDTTGFKPYLLFNGTSSSMATNSIDFSYGDKVFVCAGVRKLSDAAAGMLTELSSGAGGGRLYVVASNPGSNANYEIQSTGSASATSVTANAFAAPITNVVSGTGNISAPSVTLRVNGTQVTQSTATQGTGNYGNYPLYIGARAGSSLFFNGRLHQLVVAGKAASASEITSTETYVNQRTGAY